MIKIKEFKIFHEPVNHVINGIETKVNIPPVNVCIYEQSGQYYMSVNNQDRLMPVERVHAA